jgi:large subunit ribosomal protein L32
MAVPFRRISKTSKRMRRTHFKITATGLVTCAHCGALIKSHQICPQCGYYDGKHVVVVKAERKELAEKAKEAAKNKKEKKEKKAKKEVKE